MRLIWLTSPHSLYDMAEEQFIRNSPSILKVAAWKHFRFNEDTDKCELGKAHVGCKVCHTKINYLENIANLRNHVSRFHPERLPSTLAAAKETADPVQPWTDATLSTLLHNSEKGKRITQSVGGFISKDLRHYSVVDNTGFRHLLKTLEPRYKLPPHSHLTERVTPACYHETKAQVISQWCI